MFQRMEIKAKTANVANVNEEITGGADSHIGKFLVPFPDGDSEAGHSTVIILKKLENSEEICLCLMCL